MENFDEKKFLEYCIAKKEIKIADTLFGPFTLQLEMQVHSAKSLEKHVDYTQRVEKAAETLAHWEIESKRPQNYTPEELADILLHKEHTTQLLASYQSKLTMMNTMHQGACALYLVQSGLANRLVHEGKNNRTLSLVEISSRLAPILTFPGASAYLDAMIIPYAQKTRAILHEPQLKSYVSEEAAVNSARTHQKNFGSYYVLAETSAAPRKDVPKSKRKPEVYICGIAGEQMQTWHYIIETPFRDHFDAKVREYMLNSLDRLMAQ